jgi:DNA-binding transcriptional regulator GbsR (MarR family)
MSNNARPEKRFVEDVARLFSPWGVPPMAARIYGYLLLCREPVSLDHIAAELQVSKSTASVSARLLEQYRIARRHSVRGSKRVLYEVSDSYEGMLTAQNRLLDSMAELLKDGAKAAQAPEVHDRLIDMAQFYLVIRQAMETALQQWRREARSSGAKPQD